MGSVPAEMAHSANAANGVTDKTEPMAIIGMATRFPQQADTSENLWKFLLQGRQAMTGFPADRINQSAHYHPDRERGGTFHVKGAHFLSEDPANLDAPFFSVTKSELQTLDPQQRILMENTYQALENAGIPITKATGSSTSCFVSGFNTDYLGILNTDPETSLKYKPTGVSNSIIANRVSWFYDFKGPSMSIDTACSSSLVALHLACQSLRSGECDMSIVAGVGMLMFPTDIIGMSHHGFLSQEGKCFSFDHRADGYSRGEGVGSIVVKRLSHALADGDTIRAIIRGTGVNQDGRTAGITLPSSTAQQTLMRQVYANAGLDYSQTRLVEAHGTGTSAGDPIEASAIASTFRPSKERPLYIGALKSGIGHLEGGSGVAGVIKSIMILEAGIIPPNVNFEKVNPKIPMDKWNIKFPLENTPWPSDGLRRISVNSFGVGGTNAHAILDDAYHFLVDHRLQGIHNTSATVPSMAEIRCITAKLEEELPKTPAPDGVPTNGVAESGAHADGIRNGGPSQDRFDHNGSSSNGELRNGLVATPPSSLPRLFVLSSFDEKGVKRNVMQCADYFKSLAPLTAQAESEYLNDLAYTLSNRRSAFPWRSYCLASSLAELSDSLSNSQNIPKPVRVRAVPKVGFVFTGQGAQWHAMGRELLAYPMYEASLLRASEYMRNLGSQWSLKDELLKSKADSSINSPSLAHPSCAVLQIALVDLLSSWNVLPIRVVGHSSGEIAAAYAAGKLSREAAWKVAYYRGVVSAKPTSSKGAMLAVGLSARDLEAYMKKIDARFPGEMIIACFNSPKNNTVSGDEAKIDALKQILDSDGIFARKLNVSNAYHSAHMQQVASDYLQALGDLSFGDRLSTPQEIHMFSSITGEQVDQPYLNAQYWVDNLVSPVQFTGALSEMCYKQLSEGQVSLRLNASSETAVDDIVEVGPHPALRIAIKETLSGQVNGSSISYLPVLDRNSPDVGTLLNTIGFLSARGYRANVYAVNQSSTRGKTRPPQMLVSLPPYSFDHSERVLYESRLSKNFRMRKFPRHDLLGAPASDWNAANPRWRHFIRLSEQPWLRDHVVTGSFVYPGVGYMIMAVEASRQTADENLTVTGFRLRDVSMKRALIIPDTKDGVETSLSMFKMDESSLWASSTWNKFHVSSYNPVGDDWIEHCTGYIAVDYKTAPGPVDGGREAEAEASTWRDSLRAASKRCHASMDVDRIYDNLVTAGLKFGSLFRNLSDVKGSGEGLGEITSTVTIPDVVKSMPHDYMHSHLIHPCTMDSMLHLFLMSVLDKTGKNTLESAIVPTFVKDLWISAEIISNSATTFRGHGKSTMIAYEKYQSDIMIWDGLSEQRLVSIKGLRANPLDSAAAAAGQRRNLCHNIEWKQDSELLALASFSSVAVSSRSQDEDYRHWINQFQLAVMLRVTDALQELEDFNPDCLEGHFRRYWDWLNYQSEKLMNDSITHLPLDEWKMYATDKSLKEELFRQVDEHNGDGTLAMRMGSHIVPVLKKEVDPLQLMFGDDLMNRVYDEAVGLGDIPNLQKAYLKAVGHNFTNLKILEVGAGTGSSTAAIFDILSPVGEDTGFEASKIARYTFTDISAGFFEKARDRFKDWAEILEFKTFNAEKDPLGQGFDTGSYDFIVAGNVVHTTSDLRRTLTNLRSLLKPGGKLLMQEGVRQDFLWSPLAFGQLSGWWHGVEETRKWSPWIPVQEWDRILRDAGFAGIDLDLADRQDPALHTQSLFVATATGKSHDVSQAPGNVILVTSVPPTTPESNDLILAVQRQLIDKCRIHDCPIVHYLDLETTPLTDAICISFIELERAVLMNMTEKEYLNIRHLMSTPDGLLWLTGDVNLHPELSMMTGMIRSVRWERDVDEANIVPLAISDPRPSQDALTEVIVKLFVHQFIDAPVSKRNAEYLHRDGQFLSSRLITSPIANDFLNSNHLKPAPQMMALGEAGRPVKLSTSAPGMLDKLEFVTDVVYYEPLGDGIVEIEIKAVGLNFRDVMIAMGEHMAYSMGNEAAGVVTRVGSGVPDIKVGDRVVYMCGFESVGCFHTYGRVQWQNIVKIPDSLSYEIACGLPCVYSTVIYGLYDIARLSQGETILIHAAAGGVGQAAINLAKLVGAEIFATVSTPEKRALLMTEYDIPEDHIFSSRDLTFEKGIMRMTHGKGVDVLLNSLSGEALRRSWDIMAPFGRFIEIGKKDAQASGRIELNPFLRQMMMASVELPQMMRYKPLLFRRLIEDTVRLYEEGKIKEAKPTTVLSYEKIEEALRLLQSGRAMGKIVFKPSNEDVVPIVPETTPPYALNENATYILAGGLGGIGRSIGSWMGSRGAKNLVFLSRSGRVTGPVEKMIKDLRTKGCTAHVFPCDVSDKSRLAAVVDECRRSMPPIKGCIQGSMVLKDVMFENMSFEEFQTAVKPKVQGSWNLHELLPHDMDFFVMLSSATGILGNRSQANYAAGNAYQDALARHRVSKGLAAASVDLGTVLSVGYVAEHKEETKALATVLEVIREDEIHTITEYLMDPRSSLSQETSQLVVGLTDANFFKQRGIPPMTYLSYPLFTHLNTASTLRGQSAEENPSLMVQAQLSGATDIQEAATIVTSGIRSKLSMLLAIPVDNIDPAKSISSNGVDSLVAMEFRTWVAKDLAADVPLLDIMGTNSIAAVSQKIASVSKLVHVEATASETT